MGSEMCIRDSEYSHKYEREEAIHLWVNKVGPYHNPQETYTYYSLPFCAATPVPQLEHRCVGAQVMHMERRAESTPGSGREGRAPMVAGWALRTGNRAHPSRRDAQCHGKELSWLSLQTTSRQSEPQRAS